MEWETEEVTFDPLSVIATDDPVTCAAYPKQNVPWKDGEGSGTLPREIKSLAIKQNKIRQVRRSQTYMFGHLIPRNYLETMQFDKENKNSKWYDATKLKMESIQEYKVFKKWDKAILDKHKRL